MSDEYKRREIRTDYQRAVELYKSAINQLKQNVKTQRELTPFVKRNISKTFLDAAKLFEKSGKVEYAKHGFEGALKYAPNTDYQERAREGISRLKKSEQGGLEKQLFSIVGIVTLLFGLFFVSVDFTGYVISNPLTNDMQWIGICFFTCGLFFTFLAVRKKYFSKHL